MHHDSSSNNHSSEVRVSFGMRTPVFKGILLLFHLEKKSQHNITGSLGPPMATTHPSKAKRKGFVTPLKLLSQKETPANSITFKKKKTKGKKNIQRAPKPG